MARDNLDANKVLDIRRQLPRSDLQVHAAYIMPCYD